MRQKSVFDKHLLKTQNRIARWFSGIELIKSIFISLVVIGLIGCSSSDSGDTPDDQTLARIAVTPDDEPFISIGQEVQLQAQGLNAGGQDVPFGTVTWTSSDPTVLAVSGTGMMRGVKDGSATVSAAADGKTVSVDFRVVDLTGRWVGGEEPDTVSYTLTHAGTIVTGNFESRLGFPPITDVNTGPLSGSLEFSRYEHTLEITAEDGCQLEITGDHFVRLDGDEVILVPGPGSLTSSNCNVMGRIDFATLRRK